MCADHHTLCTPIPFPLQTHIPCPPPFSIVHYTDCAPHRYDEQEADIVLQIGADGSLDAERARRADEVKRKLAEGVRM